MPVITVGIPFYNNEKTLLNAVRSILSQTFKDWELILLDDGSTDGSLNVARSIKDPRIKVISDGRNMKLAARLNQIIDLAQGEYIARMDADDICSPMRIQQQLELLKKNNNIDVVGCGVIYLSDKDIPLGHTTALQNHEEICKQPYRGFGICHASIIARKSWYRKFRYDESIQLGQDFNLWLRSYRDSRFANIPEPLYYYRFESSYSLKKQFRDRFRSSIYIFEHYKKESLYKALFYFLIQYVKIAIEAGFYIVGAKKKLLSRRYSQLTNAEVTAYTSEIKKIKNTELPIVAT
ncbi:MAG: glycosyltransferase family 2 protein [Phycisphaerae bacterium]|jgi:glycosyltransferase involved in cell wall biosynthesis